MSQYVQRFGAANYHDLAAQTLAHLDTLNLPNDDRLSTYWLRREAVRDYLCAKLRELHPNNPSDISANFVTRVMKAM